MDITQRRRVQFLREWFAARGERWLNRRVPATSSVMLHRRNIFILPTRQGLLFITVAVVIFVAAINYGLSLAFALAFLMVSLFLLTILHTFYALQGLQLQSTGNVSGFAGETAVFNIVIKAGRTRKHESLLIGFPGEIPINCSVRNGQVHRTQLACQLKQRGRQRMPRVTVRTVYPLGLWQAWSHLDLDLECLVYPAPVATAYSIGQGHSGQENTEGDQVSQRPGAEDFQGLRNYQHGDSLRQIAWKNLARGQGLKVKEFVDGGVDSRILDWEMFQGLDKEARLSGLCHLVLQRSGAGQQTGLNMPGVFIPAGNGDEHQARLLEVLALWP